ncbi:MAG: glycoside hydrolase family 3 protein [Lachnospiraceae bacterium]|nr:glycoside hydrolase family 3 protein [Lachnospiraceae bacterium]
MESILKDGYRLYRNKGGKVLGVAEHSRVKIIERDGLCFKDFTGEGELLPYADWRLDPGERAEDLAGRLSIEEIAGLMLYSSHQMVPADNSFSGTYQGKEFKEGETKPWELTDQQKQFIEKDGVRHVLVTRLADTETAVKWNNRLQALAENTGFGIPANNSTDPRHGVDADTEYKAITGEPISKWANGVGLAATFDQELVREFGEIASREYRALGITTALSPQIDLGTEPRWMRWADTFGPSLKLACDMARAYCDGFQTTEGSKKGWGEESVNTMVKHFPGGGPAECGRDAHYGFGKYSVYPGNNFEEHLKVFSEAAFKLDGPTGKASAVMPYYSISFDQDTKNKENVGNSFNRYFIGDLLREQLGYEGVVCTDWAITADQGEDIHSALGGKCWGVENLTVAERHLKALEAGVDQFGGNNDAGPVLEAYKMACEKYGEDQARKRFERSAVRLLINIFQVGLFENPYLDLEESLAIVGNERYVEKGYLSQLKSMVLLKNREQVLPLPEKTKVYIPDRHVKPYRTFFGNFTPELTAPPVNKEAAGEYFQVVDSPEEADAALCFITSPISMGYENGYQPITLQYRPYLAESARAEGITGKGSYLGRTNTCANEADLDMVTEARRQMGEKPVIVSIAMKNPTVLAELEPYADAILVNFGVSSKAPFDILAGNFEPSGRLPAILPKDMETVERHCEDLPFDYEAYVDSQGNAYEFGFGLNFSGVIK